MKRKIGYSRFGQWLLDEVERRDTTITRLALSAGMSASTLRYLVIDPDRQPSTETCLRLARFLGTNPREVMTIAGLDAVQGEDAILPPDPNRVRLLAIYDSLPYSFAQSLFNVATSLERAAQAVKGGDAQ